MESREKGTEAKLESQTETFHLIRHAFILEHLLEAAELQWEKIKVGLRPMYSENRLRVFAKVEKSPEYVRPSKMGLMRDKAKVECLLEQMKSVQDEGKLESQRWKMRLSENIAKAEFILQEMKSNAGGLEAPGLELQLKEQIAKSELLLEEVELVGVAEEVAFEERFRDVKSPVLKMQLKKHIAKVESLLQSMKFVHEKSKEGTVELEILLREIKLAQESGKIKSSLSRSMLEAYVVKLKLLLDETELKKEKEELGSQMLEKELLLEELTKEGFLLMKYAKRLPIMDWEERHLEKILSILREMKSEHKGEELKPQVLEVILEQKEEEHATTSKSPQEKMKLMQEESNIKSPALGMQLKECIVELDGVLKEGKLGFLSEKLRFRKLKTELHRHIVELEPLLEKMKLEQEKESVWSQELKMQLNEYIAKLELLPEKTELDERHVAELKRFIVKAKEINLEREKKTMESLMLQLEERTVELTSLFEDIISVRCFERGWYEDQKRCTVKLKFLLEGIKFKQNEPGLQYQGLKIQLVLELLVKEIESTRDVKILGLKGHLEKVKFLLGAIELEREEEKLEFPALEMQLKESTVQTESQTKSWKMARLYDKALEKQLHECRVELQSLQEKMKFAQLIENVKCLPLEMELNRHIMKLRSARQALVRSFPSIENELEDHTRNSKWLLKEIESERDVGIQQPLVWKMILEGYSEKRKYHKLKIEFKQHMAKLESLLLEMKLEQEKGGPGSRALKIALEEYIVELELLLKERELICDVDILKSPVPKMRLDEHLGKVKSRLATIKLGREKTKLEFPELKEHIVHMNSVLEEMKSTVSAADVELKEHIVHVNSLLEEMKSTASATDVEFETPREQKASRPLIPQRPIIVIGGRGQDGQSLRSVEGFLFVRGRWIELPAMNIPRSFMSAVVFGNEIVVSGGDTGPAITDTIEVLNLAETPLQWRISPANLPVPLCGHQTVVYEGKLIVIGGRDGNEERNSEMIYQILLAPPYTFNVLELLGTPVAWHGAELVGYDIFIFGGEGRRRFVPTSNVFAYNLVREELRPMQCLPRAVMGMATVTKGTSVAVVGGLDDNKQELDKVFMYDTSSGEHHSLPEMNEKRGGCCAAISFTFETRSSCSSEKFTDALFVVGNERSLNTFEGYSFESRRWIDMPPMREPRRFCSMVVAPVEFETFIEYYMIE